MKFFKKSKEEQKAEILSKYNQDMNDLNYYAQILTTTIDPEEFFSSYDLYLQKLKVLSDAESSGIINVSGDSFCEKYSQMLTEEHWTSNINEFIDRVWDRYKTDEREFLLILSNYMSLMSWDSIDYFLSLVDQEEDPEPKYSTGGLNLRVVKATLEQKANILENGFDYYEYNAGDGCEACKKLDGKIFPLSQLQPGVNAPPMCKDCRCSISANTGISDEDYYAWLNSYHNHHLSYEDWKKKQNL